jgi:hypothetical protein
MIGFIVFAFATQPFVFDPESTPSEKAWSYYFISTREPHEQCLRRTRKSLLVISQVSHSRALETASLFT